MKIEVAVSRITNPLILLRNYKPQRAGIRRTDISVCGDTNQGLGI